MNVDSGHNRDRCARVGFGVRPNIDAHKPTDGGEGKPKTIAGGTDPSAGLALPGDLTPSSRVQKALPGWAIHFDGPPADGADFLHFTDLRAELWVLHDTRLA